MPDERAALEDFVLRFTDAFNRDDLDGVMALMEPHAVYAKAEVPLLRDPK